MRLPYRELDESELRLSLVDHLEPRAGGNEGLLLLVDEAHTLPLRLLEEIRLLTNLVRDGQPRVRLVLAGGMALEERLANPKLDSFQQRIAARCYLQPMARDETIYYVQEQMRRAGSRADALSRSGPCTAIHTATDGIPRLINQLCDHALMLAALGGHGSSGPAASRKPGPTCSSFPPRGTNRPARAPPRRNRPNPASSSSASSTSPSQRIPSYAIQAAARVLTRPPRLSAPSARSRAIPPPSSSNAIESGLSALSEEGAEPGSEFTAKFTAEFGDEIAAEPRPKDGEQGDFSPVDESDTEVELIFHSAHDPFGGGWEEEEVVIDRYAMLEEARLRRVASDEGRQIGAALMPRRPRPSPSSPRRRSKMRSRSA